MTQNSASHIEQQKIKLEKKKNRLATAETILRLKEQKLHTRNLIKFGELIVKTKLNKLPVDTLYGALISVNEQLEKDLHLTSIWSEKGVAALKAEHQEKAAIILKFDDQYSDENHASEIRETVRSYGLRWNNLRKEWGGYISDLDTLKQALGNISYNLEIVSE